MFKLSLTREELKLYVLRQMNNFFPDSQPHPGEELLDLSFDQALERAAYCFKYVSLKAYNNNGTTFFNHLHSDQYTVFLWFLSNSIWKNFGDEALATKIFYLNKVLNGFLCMYDANMPSIFLVLHGTGTVLGKATYEEFFVCCHGCTVGAVHGQYPVIGKGVAMAPQSTIVGNCKIGDGVTIGTNALLRNRNIESGLLYYQDIETGKNMTKPVARTWAQSFFNVPIPCKGDSVD